MIPFPPLSFSGKTVITTYQMVTERGLIPYSFAGQDESDEESAPVAVVVHHFDHCFVRSIVRIILQDRKWVITAKGMDHPDAEPWFLIAGYKDQGSIHSRRLEFVVNSDYQIYPLRLEQLSGSNDQPGPFEGRPLMSPECWKQGVDWTDFSAVDKEAVEASIQAFLTRAGLC